MDDNQKIVHKIFIGSRLANLVHYVFSGAPNAYTWDQHAIRCAYLRRNILKKLTHFWFSDRVDVSEAYDVEWNAEYKAYELQAEPIDGRTASLKHCFHTEEDDALSFHYLKNNVMLPLQKKLKESGFDGLVWQAGMGNPVAANNFLRTESSWVWIDLESGVPALIPLNPLPLFTFYLPKSFRHRRALFDDVDINKLQTYLQSNHEQLNSFFSESDFSSLQKEIEELQQQQNLWRNTKRIHRALTYAHKKNKINDEQLAFYKRFSFLWYGREIFRILWLVIQTLFFLPKKIVQMLMRFPLPEKIKKAIKFVFSQKYREQKARSYVQKSVKRWQQRQQLRPQTVQKLEEEMGQGDASAFITDFGVHIAIKPFVKTFEYVFVPFLLFSKVINLPTSIFLILIAGPVARSLYTLFRILQNSFYGQRKPWVALFVGIIPVLGNLAYPVQMIYSASSDDGVATFILYDSFSKFGIYMPIWGGEDTATEHFFNRFLYTCLSILKRKPSQG
ncbi:hypothetical protein [Candidatus Uabimicrobium amorphum]|nr:hypothetical protein [Candidatus Uabimicrobium amorphum]